MNKRPAADFLISESKEALCEEERSLSESRWTNQEYFAEGGLKKLYKVYDRWNERVVIKAVPKNDNDHQSFINEAQRLASLEHPYILPVYDIGTEDGKPYFIMKLIEGTRFSQVLKQGKLSQEQSIDIFIKLCNAVSYSHKSGVLHLDIKPDNIQISEFGDITLCDWGSSRFINDFSNKLIAATPAYMAPEMYNGEASIQSDIYVLGLLLFEILSGSNPFVDSDLEKTIAKNKKAEVNLSLISHKSLRAICIKALKKDQAYRYHSVNDLLDDLEQFKLSLPVSAEQAGVLRKSYLFCRRHPHSLLVVLFLLSALVITVFIFAGSLNSQRQKAEDLAQKYLKERDQRLELSETQSDILSKQAWIAFNQYRHREAQNLVDLSLHKKRLAEALLLKGVLAMISFKPDEARNIFQNLNASEVREYSQQLEVLMSWEDLLKENPEKWIEQIITFRKFDAFFYHHYIGHLMNSSEISDEKKEIFINQLYKNLITNREKDFQVKILENGRKLVFLGKIAEIHLFPFKALRVKKLDLSQSSGSIHYYTMTNLHYFSELEEINFLNTGYTNYTELQGLPLKKLSVDSFGGDKYLKYLQLLPINELTLGGTNIDDLRPLLKFTKLRKINIPKQMINLPGFKKVSEKYNVKIINN